jgi:putative Holliday junction resolvase
MGRVLAVDPGEARIGLAVSDPTRTLARPLKILTHRSRAADAQAIVEEAKTLDADLILIGLPLDAEGRAGPQARRSLRLVEAVRRAGSIEVATWDESGTTQMAIELGGRQGLELDARAAAVLLQEFLDGQA